MLHPPKYNWNNCGLLAEGNISLIEEKHISVCLLIGLHLFNDVVLIWIFFKDLPLLVLILKQFVLIIAEQQQSIAFWHACININMPVGHAQFSGSAKADILAPKESVKMLTN